MLVWSAWAGTASLAVGLAAFAATLALGGWTLRMERVVYDGALSLWKRSPPADVLIIAIDDASVQSIGRWPWRRVVHATLLERLAAAHPRAIALDLLLSEPDPDPEQDRLLALALQHAAPVVAPVTWQSDGAGQIVALQPAPSLRGSLRLGAAESSVESDGVLRDAFLRTGSTQDGDTGYPSLALALLQAGGETVNPRSLAAVESLNTPQAGALRRQGRFAIRYLGAPGTVHRVSYVDVLAGAVSPELLAGRYVLVGMTAQGLGDTLATPVNGTHVAMPGVEVHANLLYTLRSGDAIRTPAAPWMAGLSAALVLMLVTGLQRLGAHGALPLALSAPVLAVAASVAALGAGWWVSPVPFAMAAALAYPLWSWLRLERAVRRLDGEIDRLGATIVPLLTQTTPAGVGLNSSDPIESRLNTLRQAGERLHEARRFLAEAITALPAAVLVSATEPSDSNGKRTTSRVLLANPQAAALFEVEGPEQLLGLDLAGLLGEFRTRTPLDWPDALARLHAGAAAVAVEAHRGEVNTVDHRELVVHAAAVQTPGLDTQAGQRLIVTLADIAPVKQAERSREESLAFISHDLRSPAQSIVLLADLNLQGHLQTPPESLLVEVRRLAARTLALSEGFVRAAQAETQALRYEQLDLPQLFEEVLGELRPQALHAGVRLETQIDHDDPMLRSAQGDRILLQRALGNLLSNAIRHSAPGMAVVLSASRQVGLLRLSVRDTGPGLSEAQSVQLERGVAGEAAGAPVGHPAGVGLGLLFVQRVARRHAGALRVEPRAAGRGTHVHIELPCTDAGAQEIP